MKPESRGIPCTSPSLCLCTLYSSSYVPSLHSNFVSCLSLQPSLMHHVSTPPLSDSFHAPFLHPHIHQDMHSADSGRKYLCMIKWREAMGNLGSGFCFSEKETPPLRAKGMILGDRVLRDTHQQEKKQHGSPEPQRALSRDKNDTMRWGWRNGKGCNGPSGQFDPAWLSHLPDLTWTTLL